MRRRIVHLIFVIVLVGVIISYIFLDYNSLLQKLFPTKPSEIKHSSNFSFIIGTTAWMSPDCDTDAQLMVDAGINYVRIPVNWESVEPTEGNFDFSYYDDLLDCLDAHNLSYMFVLEYWVSPRWAQEKWNIPPFFDYTDTLSDQYFLEAYVRFIESTVDRYKGRVKIYQVCNELNNYLGVRLGVRWEMKKASNFIKLGFNTIKETDPGAMVTTGLSTARNWRVFLKDYLVDYEDIVSLQTYKSLDEIHEDSSFLPQFGKPVIITETGKSMCPDHVTAEEQADFIYEVVNQIHSDGLDGVFIFMWRDSNCPDSCHIDPGHCMGLIDQWGNLKPAYNSLQQITSEIQ